MTGQHFVFIHVPRTGGKSITKLLAPYGQETLPGQASRHTTALEARALLGDAGWNERLRFSVVRNPWDRLLSLHAFHAQTPEQLFASTRQRASRGFVEAHRLFTSLGSFDGFLAWIAEGPRGTGDVERHRYSQLSYLRDDAGKLLVERICRYESLAEDVQAVARDLSLSTNLPWINGLLRPHYSRYYSAEGRDRVARVFAEEIAHFGYAYEAG